LRTFGLIGVCNGGEQFAQEPEKTGLRIVGVPPLWNEFACHEESIDWGHPKKLDLHARLPSLDFPDDVETQNVLPVAVVTVHSTHMVLVCGDHFWMGISNLCRFLGLGFGLGLGLGLGLGFGWVRVRG
jgi:hypothetical protein